MMKIFLFIFIILFGFIGFSDETIHHDEAMEEMPLMKPKRIYNVTGKEDFPSIMGYGREDGVVNMMNLMMVEGSKMKMEMEPMHSHEFTSKSLTIKAVIQPNPPIVGENKILFSLMDSGHKINGAKLKAYVEMASMDMGSEEAQIKELAHGNYEVRVKFLMSGPWKVKIEGHGPEKSEGEIFSELIFDAGAKEPWSQSK